MDPKTDLKERIRRAYELVQEYEDEIGLAGDPKAKRRYRRRVDEQWESIDDWLPDCLRLYRESGTVPPEDIQQLITLRNIDNDAEPDESDKDSEQAVASSTGIESERMFEDIAPAQGHRTELFDVLASRFDKGELRTLCFRLKVDYDGLPGEGKAEKARELILFLERRDLISNMVEIGKKQRPDIAWDRFLEEEDQVFVPETVLIPESYFWMGSHLEDPVAHENERPRNKRLVREYSLARYPVTNAQYADFVLDTDHKAPKHWAEGKVPAGLEDHPVVNVNYEDAEAYCRWLSRVTGRHYRLPTEEEWEKAARGGLPETRCYPWGEEWRSECSNTRELNLGGTTSVHKFESVNQSPYGVVGMVGNVWEWTASWYERYPDSSYRSLSFGRTFRVVRGGSWRNDRERARITCRGRYKPQVRRPYLGFRVALD